jgi:N-acetylmuramoyl-L-alanine amidase
MHFTTGTQVNQAINTFTNPEEGTSIHLIIGRDGRVIQMVPFDRAAFHAGTSFWEKQSGLNAFSIGIELDNAGDLRRTRDGLNWQRKGVIIPEDRTAAARHPKDFRERQWERFPQQQVDAAFAVARALVAEFGLEDIIGHDQVNFLNRMDPGPLFEPHMREFRQSIYGRPDPRIEDFRAAPPEGVDRIDFYVNREGRKPKLNHPVVQGAGATKGKLVKVFEQTNPWWRIKLKSGSRAEGWMDKANLRVLTEVTKIDRDNAVLFQILAGRDAGPPPTIHPDDRLPAGTLMRLQRVSGDMALVVARIGAEPLVREVEGWVRCVDIE